MKYPSRKCVGALFGRRGYAFWEGGQRKPWAGHRLPAVVVVNAEEGASEGHYFSVGDEYAGVDLSWWGGDKGSSKQGDAEEAE